MEDYEEFYEGKRILVTGGAGSIGSEISKKILELKPEAVRVLDINETGLFELEQRLRSDRLRIFIGDVRDRDRLKRAIEDVDIVFHAAALKHVPLCEYNPFEAIKTNVIGTQNLIEVAMDEEAEKFIGVSTDKTVNPINVMGATKLLAEKLAISANAYKGNRKTAFSCVRFGNVVGSRGSVVSVIVEQIEKGDQITITDPDMTRFIMTVDRAVELVLKAAEIAKGGEVFILKMPALRVIDLAEAVIEEISSMYGYESEEIKIKVIGKRPGEKMHEQLMTEDEMKNAYETKDMFVILPQTVGKLEKIPRTDLKRMTSNNVKLLTKQEIRNMLKNTVENVGSKRK